MLEERADNLSTKNVTISRAWLPLTIIAYLLDSYPLLVPYLIENFALIDFCLSNPEAQGLLLHLWKYNLILDAKLKPIEDTL